MKKFLSLVLALVMTMSLVTITAGATDFTDNKDIKYGEAVDVVKASGIIDGFTDGSFQPNGTLTREQAAKLVCVLAVGKDVADKLGTNTAPYKDVAPTRWSAGYIAYCANAGIVDGYADGNFYPTRNVTGYQFLKMLLGVLGYKSGVEGFTGTNWTVAVGKIAIQAGLVDGNDSFVGTTACARQEAALYCFNLLQADEVYYEQTGTSITVSGTTIVTGTSSAKKVVNNNTRETIANDDVMQFAEEHFAKLVLTHPTNTKGEPTNKWTYDNTKVGTYAKTAVFTYTKKTDAKDLTDDISSLTFDNDNLPTVTVNGVAAAAVKDKNGVASLTKNGRLVEVYASNNIVTYIAVVDTFAATVTKVNTKDEEVTVLVYQGKDGDKVISEKVVVGKTDDGYAYLKDLKVDDWALVNAVIENGKATSLIDAFKPETITGKYTKFVSDKYTIGGEEYKANVTLSYENLEMEQSGTCLLDAYGFLVATGVKMAEDTYAYILNASREGSGKAGYTYSLKLLTTDGKIEWVDVTKIDGEKIDDVINDGDQLADWNFLLNWNKDDGMFITFTKLADGTYDIAEANYVDDVDLTFKNGVTVEDDSDYDYYLQFTSSTIFLVEQEDGTFKVYTGYKNVPSMRVENVDILVLNNDEATANVVVVRDGDVLASKNEVFIYQSTSVGSSKINSVPVRYFKALVNGEDTKVAVAETELNEDNTLDIGLYVDNSFVNDKYIDELGDLLTADNDQEYADPMVYIMTTVGEQGHADYMDTIYVFSTNGKIYLSETDPADLRDLTDLESYVKADEFAAYEINMEKKDADTLAVGSKTNPTVLKADGEYIILGIDTDSAAIVSLYVVGTPAPAAAITYDVATSKNVMFSLDGENWKASLTDVEKNTTIFVKAAEGYVMKNGEKSFKLADNVEVDEYTAIVDGNLVLAAFVAGKDSVVVAKDDAATVTASAVKAAVNAEFTDAAYSYKVKTYSVAGTSVFAGSYTPIVAGAEVTTTMNVTVTVTISGVTFTQMVPVEVTISNTYVAPVVD